MKIITKLLVTALSVTLLSTAYADEEEFSLVSTKRLSLFTATAIAQAAIKECSKLGIQITSTIVDRDGNVQVVLRDTIASPMTVIVSKGKAFAAANFNSATSTLTEQANSPIGRTPGVIMSAGGLPIQVGGALVGAIGVSGAPSGATDEQCAQAGIDAVLDDLEMSM